MWRPKILFDRQDFELVDLVNEFLARGKRKPKTPRQLRKLFDSFLHPRGIKELAATRQRRIAYAVIRLLDSLEEEEAGRRILALRSLQDEVLHNTSGSMRINTARALIEIMKQIVREGYQVPPNVTRTAPEGNIVTLGGFEEAPNNGLSLEAPLQQDAYPGRVSWRNLNSRTRDLLKVFIGFAPAFVTFFLTKGSSSS